MTRLLSILILCATVVLNGCGLVRGIQQFDGKIQDVPPSPTVASVSFLSKGLPVYRQGIIVSWGTNINMTIWSITSLDTSAFVTLIWTPSSDTNVVSYKLYQGTNSGQYTVTLDASNALSLVAGGLSFGTTYYFAASATDNQGYESVFSNESSYTTPPQPQWQAMTNLTATEVFIPCNWSNPMLLFRTSNTNGILTTNKATPVYL